MHPISSFLQRSALAGASALALCLSFSAPAQAAYSAVYAFGDSLTDNGNLLSATTQAFGAANALPQASDYWNGRFSSGTVAVEQMASRLSLPLFDFAFGGATSGAGPSYPTGPGTSFSTGLQAQVGLFSQAAGGQADPTGLYFIWIGANDFRDAFSGIPAALQQGGAAAVQTLLSTAVQAVAANVGAAVTSLHSLGANDFFLPLMPDFGLTPEGRKGQAAFDAVAPGLFSFSAVSEEINAGLRNYYENVLTSSLGVDVLTFDTLANQRLVQANPSAYGVGDVLTPCFSGYVGEAGTQCDAGFDTTNMYWDKVHPSHVTHEVLGNMMAAAVPEPATVLTMAIGVLALLGHSARRARRG